MNNAPFVPVSWKILTPCWLELHLLVIIDIKCLAKLAPDTTGRLRRRRRRLYRRHHSRSLGDQVVIAIILDYPPASQRTSFPEMITHSGSLGTELNTNALDYDAIWATVLLMLLLLLMLFALPPHPNAVWRLLAVSKNLITKVKCFTFSSPKFSPFPDPVVGVVRVLRWNVSLRKLKPSGVK